MFKMNWPDIQIQPVAIPNPSSVPELGGFGITKALRENEKAKLEEDKLNEFKTHLNSMYDLYTQQGKAWNEHLNNMTGLMTEQVRQNRELSEQILPTVTQGLQRLQQPISIQIPPQNLPTPTQQQPLKPQGNFSSIPAHVQSYVGTPYVSGGGHGGKSKGLDCSGFVGSLLHKSGIQGYAGLTADQQIRRAEKNGTSIQTKDLNSLQVGETALIGLTRPNGERKPGRYNGIAHIAVAYRDPSTGQMLVADSSNSKGVHTTSLGRYMSYYNGREGRIPYIVKL